MKTPGSAIKDRLVNYVSQLRFPWLVGITATLFIVSVAIPPLVDPIPFIDEIILGLCAAILATLKKRRKSPLETTAGEPPKVVEQTPGPGGAG
jgi:hypothetical protein